MISREFRFARSYGVFNSASKVGGVLSKGLASLSLDREYVCCVQ